MALSDCFAKIFGRRKKEEKKTNTADTMILPPASADGTKTAATTAAKTATNSDKAKKKSTVTGSSDKARRVNKSNSSYTASAMTSRSSANSSNASKTAPSSSDECKECRKNRSRVKSAKKKKSGIAGVRTGRTRSSRVSSPKKSGGGGRRCEHTTRREDSNLSSAAQSPRSNRMKQTLFSRPIAGTALKKMAERVEARRHEAPKKKTKKGDLSFPKRRSSRSTTQTTEDITTKAPTQVVLTNASPRCPRRVASNIGLVWEPVKNFDNDGKLFIRTREGAKVPFWKEEQTEIDAAEETEDDMVLNADSVLDVLNGTLQLAEAPEVEVLFDAYQPVQALQKKDSLFFTPALLLGNSLRSMINLTEPLGFSGVAKASEINAKQRKERKPLEFDEPPGKATHYNEKGELKQRPWKPTGKKIIF